jgi:hypothetical protein
MCLRVSYKKEILRIFFSSADPELHQNVTDFFTLAGIVSFFLFWAGSCVITSWTAHRSTWPGAEKRQYS